MKRFLLLFCTVVLFCSIMIVPAFAAESYTATFSEADSTTLDLETLDKLNGWYILSLSSSNPVFSYTFEPAQFCLTTENLRDCVVDLVCDGAVICTFMPYTFDSHNELYFGLQGVAVDFPNLYEVETTILTFTPCDPPEGWMPEPEPPSLIDNLGTFFTQVIAWLGAVAVVVTESPALLVLVIGMIVVGVVVAYLKRAKNM